MALTQQQIQQMDQITGLGQSNIQPKQSDTGILSTLGDIFAPGIKNFVTAPFDPNSQMNKNRAARPDPTGNLLQSTINAAGQTGDFMKGAAGAGVDIASYNPELLFSKLRLLKGLLPRGAAGVVTGGGQEMNREGATPESIGVNAGVTGGLNAILPALSRILTSGLGRTAFGKGGEKMPDLVREVGPLIGGGDSMTKQLYGKTEPIRNKLTDLLDQSSMSKNDVFTNELVDSVSNPTRVGFEGVDPSLEKLFSIIDNFDQLTGNVATPGKNVSAPLTKWQELLQGTRADLPRKTWLQNLTTSPTAGEKTGKAFSGTLRGKIKEKSVNPDEYDRLNSLLQAATEISHNQPRGLANNAANIFRQLIPGLGSGLAFGVPGAVVGGAMGQPQVASTLISLLESLPADVVRNLTSRGVGTGIGSTQRE